MRTNKLSCKVTAAVCSIYILSFGWDIVNYVVYEDWKIVVEIKGLMIMSLVDKSLAVLVRIVSFVVAYELRPCVDFDCKGGLWS